MREITANLPALTCQLVREWSQHEGTSDVLCDMFGHFGAEPPITRAFGGQRSALRAGPPAAVRAAWPKHWYRDA